MHFVLVFPRDYRRALTLMEKQNEVDQLDSNRIDGKLPVSISVCDACLNSSMIYELFERFRSHYTLFFENETECFNNSPFTGAPGVVFRNIALVRYNSLHLIKQSYLLLGQ